MLPCGAGKTLVGIVAATTIKRSCLVLCNSSVSVEQWYNQFLMWTHLPKERVTRFTQGHKDPPHKEACVLVATYNMITHKGSRGADSKKVMDDKTLAKLFKKIDTDGGGTICSQELQDFIGLEAFPNPAEDVLNVRFDGVDGLADIRVFDLSGQVILSERTRVVPGMVITYGTDEFRPGIYILEVRNGLQRSTLRLTVK